MDKEIDFLVRNTMRILTELLLSHYCFTDKSRGKILADILRELADHTENCDMTFGELYRIRAELGAFANASVVMLENMRTV
jgi:hypothetical protein